ncbi:acyl-CoA N-acyltransferase, partial [Coniella lustricola]
TYKARLPPRPLPSISARPHIRTRRLVIRPFLPSDLEAFYALRRVHETQAHSTSRGRAVRDLEEARNSLAGLQAPHDEHHWYFGAFLASTGELVGEGGLADIRHQPVSGWPRCEMLISPAFWRQGYGTEFFDALLNSWWDLPRERRKHQLLPFCIGDQQEPGREVIERLELIWEADNVAACNFFPKA